MRVVKQIKVGEFWNRETNFAYCNERDTSSSFAVGGGRVRVSLHIYQQNKLHNYKNLSVFYVCEVTVSNR